jgi:hypothetical protein
MCDMKCLESDAAERIVCSCRALLSRQKYRRLESDLYLVLQRRKTRIRDQNSKATCIQRVFRGYQLRTQCRNVDQEKAVELANVAFQNTIAFNRKTRIQELEEKRTTLSHLFQIHEKRLIEVQLKIECRQAKIRSMLPTPDPKTSDSFLSESSLKYYEVILNSIKDELDFVNKLRVKNHAHVLRLEENFSTLDHNDNVMMSISKFLNRNRKDLPFYYNRKGEESKNDIVQRMRWACDHDLERILYRENNIINADITALLHASQMSTYKVEMLMKLRGYEVEDHCLHLYVQKNQVKTLEAAHIIDWIDSVQDKLYRCRKELTKVFHDLEEFYKEEEDRMNTLVLFSNLDTTLGARCKISPIGEPSRFDFKKWKDDYQQGVAFKDSPHHMDMIKLRDYIDDRCKFLREMSGESVIAISDNQLQNNVEDGNECRVFHRTSEAKGIFNIFKAHFVTAKQLLSKNVKRVMNNCRNSSILPVMDKDLNISQRRLN